MANGIVPQQTQPITFDMAIAASTLVKMTHKNDASLHRAVDKAALRLIDQPWRIVEGRLEIVSMSKPGEIHHCDDTWCTCPTTKGVCWHIGAWTLLSAIAATGVNVAPIVPLVEVEIAVIKVVMPRYTARQDAEYARVTAAVDDMF